MSRQRRHSRNDQPKITYGQNRVKGASFELSDFVLQEHAPTVSDSNEKINIKSQTKSAKGLSTTEFLSAVGQIWDLVNPCVVGEPKGKLNDNDACCQRNVIFAAPTLDDDNKYCCIDVRNASHITSMVQPKFEFLKVTQKLSVFGHEDYTRSLFLKFLKGHTKLSNKSCNGKGLARVGLSYEQEKIYGWMKEMIPNVSKYPINVTNKENKKTRKTSISESTTKDEDSFGNATQPAENLEFKRADDLHDLVNSNDVSLNDGANVVTNITETSSLYLDILLGPVQDINVSNSISRTPISHILSDYHIDYENSQHNIEDNEVPENARKQPKFVTEDKKGMEVQSSLSERPHYGLAKQEHAFAGAFAGIFVGLCLHPVDTIKTVIQSCRAEKKSLCYIGKSIVSERGVSGLYRGIASNIASSAPISATYTFTYESVKGSLIPLFPKEYHSLAHCIGGGCASIATSFIFTPSERIKQQMQIGSHYHNCWTALVGVIGKGGLPSLYTGWGAVLCRNVPHSIIKFYTYENLKQLMISSQSSSAQPSTLQTLVCGGLAGSTASLFTTPFDVVKTRLQTQIPGSMSQYEGVFHALLKIGRNEGLKGLYRGLIPRFVIYMSQGALFFTSYECFKRLFSLEFTKLDAQRENNEEDLMPLELPS